MQYDVIINLFDEHNEGSILATAKFLPKEVMFIFSEGIEAQLQVNKLRNYYKRKFPNINLIAEAVNDVDFKKVENLINRYSDKKILINLTGGNRVLRLVLFYVAQILKIPTIYIDLQKELLITFFERKVEAFKESFVDLDIDDIVESIGASIVLDCKEICKDEAINKLTDMIADNLLEWEKLKYRLYDKKVFIHDESNPVIVRINMNYITNKEMHIYFKILNMLKSYNELDYYEEKDRIIKVHFLNSFIKSFIFKSGTWLEVLTRRTVEEIDTIDDVKSGVLLMWNDERRTVKNEIDVVAIKDSVLICISCKDSGKYDEVALNELNVYSNQLGGDSVKKILVATKMPFKNAVLERAKQMDISIVIFDGNKKEFKNKLTDIIMDKV